MNSASLLALLSFSGIALYELPATALKGAPPRYLDTISCALVQGQPAA